MSYIHMRDDEQVDGVPRGLFENKIKSDNVTAHNKEIEHNELTHWETKPSFWDWYVTETAVTTFLGTKVGTIIKSNTYKNNFDSKITSITMRGTNGAIYHGRYGSDWSQLCRFRKAKKSVKE